MQKRRRFHTAIIISLFLSALTVFSIWLAGIMPQQEQLNTDLIIALRTGQVEEVKSLLSQGADPNARDLPDDFNSKPRGLLQEIMELITHPRHPEVEQARTALSCATDSKQAVVLVKLLLDKGASVKADEKCELPALFWASRGGDIATVRLLLEHGADVNGRNNVGFTPLQGAVLADKPELVRLLLDHGAQAQAGNNIMGQTLSSMAHSTEIVKMLKQKNQEK